MLTLGSCGKVDLTSKKQNAKDKNRHVATPGLSKPQRDKPQRSKPQRSKPQRDDVVQSGMPEFTTLQRFASGRASVSVRSLAELLGYYPCRIAVAIHVPGLYQTLQDDFSDSTCQLQ